MPTPHEWAVEAERILNGERELFRFWSKVDRSGECWLWSGAKTSAGYGEFYLAGSMVYAHRYSDQLVRGPIPKGVMVLHRCDAPSCVNPDHLFRGTHQDNMDDMWRKGRGNPGRAVGEDHPQAKLSLDDVRAIRARRFAGESREALAAEFGITPSYVYDLVARRAWSHV